MERSNRPTPGIRGAALIFAAVPPISLPAASRAFANLADKQAVNPEQPTCEQPLVLRGRGVRMLASWRGAW